MAKRLFNQPPKAEGQNGLATTRWVARFVGRMLKRIQVTGSSGVNITGDEDGHLHLDFTNLEATASGSHPFKVELATDPATNLAALKIWPGLAVEYGRATSGAWLHTSHAPRVAGLALTEPRFLPLASRVMITVTMNGNTGNAITPFIITSTNGNPPAVPLIRGYGTIPPQNSSHGIVIAEHSNGVITQIVTNNLRVSSHWNQVVASF